jgi:hypothetical protein
MTESPNGTLVATTNSNIVDASGTTWSLAGEITDTTVKAQLVQLANLLSQAETLIKTIESQL